MSAHAKSAEIAFLAYYFVLSLAWDLSRNRVATHSTLEFVKLQSPCWVWRHCFETQVSLYLCALNFQATPILRHQTDPLLSFALILEFRVVSAVVLNSCVILS